MVGRSPTWPRFTFEQCGKRSDDLYRLLDHAAFFQRLKWFGTGSWPKEQADRFDRFVEVFWLTEIIALSAFEALKLKRCVRHHLQITNKFKNIQSRDVESGTIGDQSSNTKKLGSPVDIVVESKRAILKCGLNLFKLLFCDLLCVGFVLSHFSFRDQRRHRLWCGFAGMIASFISLRNHWEQIEKEKICTPREKHGIKSG